MCAPKGSRHLAQQAASQGRSGTQRIVGAEERASLELGPTEPVLHLLHHILDRDGLLFQVDVSVFAASTQRLRYEMRVG